MFRNRARGRARALGIFSNAAISINFVPISGASTSLDPRITFSRTSNATLIGSDGTLQYAPHNLLTYSEQFDNAAWAQSSVAISSNVLAAPNGTVTADKIVEANVAATAFQAFQSPTLTNGLTYTFSSYIKAGERTWAILRFGNAISLNAYFNLASGTVGIVDSGLTATIQALGNGWYRCTATHTVAAVTAVYGVVIGIAESNGVRIYNGDGVSGIYVWGAQLNVGALQPYYQTIASAYYGPRFDYDPVTLAAKGLLIEEQRTNSIRNNTMRGAVVGTPGTLPTNWAYGQLSTLTTEIVSTGLEAGVNYVDIRISGTATTTALVYFEANSTVVAVNAQTWATALFVKRVGGTETNISVPTTTLRMSDSAGTNLGFVPGSTFSLPTSAAVLSACRFTSSYTTSNASTAFVMPALAFNAAGAIDITIRIGLPQLELGAFATSVIPTTTTALTRAADVASMTGANFSSWYNQTEGTVAAEFSHFRPGGFPVIASINNGSLSDRINLIASTTAQFRGSVVAANVAQAEIATGTYTVNSIGKIAVATKANDFALAASSGVIQIDTSGTMPPVDRLQLGFQTGGLDVLNGHIRSFAYYPTRLSNETLQSLTTSSTPASWTPAQISTALWLDAADAGTITLNSGNVSQWNDKSGNGRNVSQAAAASQPAYNTAAFNSKPALVFDGVNDGIRRTGQVFDPSNSNLFLAIEYRNAVKTLQSVVASDVSGSAPYLYLQADAGALKGYGGNYVSAGTYSLNQREITQISRLATGNIELYRSGTLAGSGAAGIATINDGFTFGVLGNGTFGTFAAMAIAEAVVVSGVLTTADRQQIEGYLAWKWGGI